MYPHHPGGQGQLPSHWNSQPPPSSQPPTNGTYPPPPSHIPTTLPPPPPPQEPRAEMAALQQLQQPYRLPAPHEMYRGGPPPSQDPYRPPPHMAYAPQPQSAPRQRTAIACRYCRRRKIRCSGFDASDDGRCTNCVRFSQECIFTPVSAQAQAFVPAHTVWRGNGQPPALYGAYGNPLPPAQHHQEAYAPPPPRQQGYPLPSPTASSSASYHSAPQQPQPQPYYSAQQPRRASPQSTYSYDPSRASSSPHTQGAPSTPGATTYPAYSTGGLRPLPVRADGRTPPPPPTSQPGSRPGMRITDIVSGDTGRSATDSVMLNALNRRPM